jgi:hypothetical protein
VRAVSLAGRSVVPTQLLRKRQQQHKSPTAQRGGTPDQSGAASPGLQAAEPWWERRALGARRKSERIIKSHHTHTPLGRWRPTWRVRNRIGCCECVCLGRRACHLLGRERNRRHLTTHLKCDDSFPRVRIAILLFHLAIIISQGTQSGSPPRDGRASLKSSYSPELHHDWSVCHHVHACFLQGIKQA